jgi:hypothetical protein
VTNDGAWQTSCLDAACGLITGSARRFPNVVWGTLCAGADCDLPWDARMVFGTSDGEGDTVVWGTNDGEQDTVVWGTSDGEGDTVVWGTSCSDASCEPIVWNSR